MIIINGIDGSGKTTVSKIIQEKYDMQYLHYYSFFYIKKINNNTKQIITKDIKKNFYISFIKESIFAIYKLCFLLTLRCKKKIIIDRTFIDVYIDLTVKFGNQYPLNLFLIFEKIFRFFKTKGTCFIYLHVDNYKIVLERKSDENKISAQNKFSNYKNMEVFFNNSIKINATNSSANNISDKIYKEAYE